MQGLLRACAWASHMLKHSVCSTANHSRVCITWKHTHSWRACRVKRAARCASRSSCFLCRADTASYSYAKTWVTMCTLVSGVSVQATLVSSCVRACCVGGTLDDSLGEAFDKAARCLGLPFEQGGAACIVSCA